MAGEIRSDPFREASKLAGRSKCVNQEATKVIARVKWIAGVLGVPSRSTLGEGHTDIVALELSMIGLPGVVTDFHRLPPAGLPGAPRLDGWPMRPPVNASPKPSRATAHDSLLQQQEGRRRFPARAQDTEKANESQ